MEQPTTAVVDKEDFRAAVTDFTEAIRLHPNHLKAYASRGEARYHLQRHRGAIADFTTVIRANRQATNCWYNRGVAYSDLLDFTSALSDLRQALELGHPAAAYAIEKIEALTPTRS